MGEVDPNRSAFVLYVWVCGFAGVTGFPDAEDVRASALLDALQLARDSGCQRSGALDVRGIRDRALVFDENWAFRGFSAFLLS